MGAELASVGSINSTAERCYAFFSDRHEAASAAAAAAAEM